MQEPDFCRNSIMYFNVFDVNVFVIFVSCSPPVAEHRWYIRFACINYGQFIAICCKVKRSVYIQEPLVIGGVEYRERFNLYPANVYFWASS
jgi:hypothetical protein